MPKQKARLHPSLISLRDVIQGLIDEADAEKADEARVLSLAVSFAAVLLSLVSEFGDRLEKLIIPDGYFDGFDQTARKLFLMAVPSAITDSIEKRAK